MACFALDKVLGNFEISEHGCISCGPHHSWHCDSIPNGITSGDFGKDFRLGDEIGKGCFSKVYACHRISALKNEPQLAVKVVDKHMTNEIWHGEFDNENVKLGKSRIRTALDEAQILKDLQHPHIVEVFALYDNSDSVYIVTDHLAGGSLLDQLVHHATRMTEQFMATVAMQLFSALSYLEREGIIHRDVKAENILFKSPPGFHGSCHTKLIDFGFATSYLRKSLGCFSEPTNLHVICGSAKYMAPELVDGAYGPKVDVWSAGVVLYLCMYSAFPFTGKDEADTWGMIQDVTIYPSFQCSKRCAYKPSSVFQSFILDVLDKDHSTRPTAAQVLSHQWVIHNVALEGMMKPIVTSL